MSLPDQREGLNAFIEQVHAQWACSSDKRIALVKKQAGNPTAHISVPTCNMWACPECSERNAKRWQHRIMKGVSHYQRKGYEFSFVTLTLRGDMRQRLSSIETWRKVFPRVIERHRRAVGTVPYATIPELHKNGVVHMHIIIASNRKTRWWKDACYLSGGGFMAKAIPIADHVAAVSYVTKYLGKSLGLQKWPKNYRRIRVTNDWPRQNERSKSGSAVWEVYRASEIDYVIGKLERLGYTVVSGYGKAERILA